jgi:hypothetical protein
VFAALLAGAASGLQAQEPASGTGSLQSAPQTSATDRSQPAPRPAEAIAAPQKAEEEKSDPAQLQFRDADGKPLPPEMQQQLRERFAKDLQPPAGDVTGSGASAAGPAVPELEFRDADGKPLPPEVQRQLRERFANDLQSTPGKGGAPPPGAGERDIVVTGERPRGSVTSDIPAEHTFQQLDLRAYGAGDIQELLETLGPQVRSDRGREDSGPVVLLNGRRVSSLAEIAKIPTEAIERMEIFPEELALSYGYPADQKVVNVVVFARFSSRIAQATYAVPTEGGREAPGASFNYLNIIGDTRLSFDGEYGRAGALLESERNIAQADGSPEAGRFRTLLPETERLALNGTVSGNLIENISSTLNGRFEASSSKSLFGLGTAGPLVGNSDTRIAHLGTTIGGQVSNWQWIFTGNYDRLSIDSVIDADDAAVTRNEGRSVNSLFDANLIMSGNLLDLPAGPVSTSVRGGVDLRDFSSRSVVREIEQKVDLSRDRGTIQASLDVPIASTLKDEMAWLGNLSVNANLQLERLSDFGTLRTFGYGLSWSPTASINLIASVTHEEGAPTVEQLGGPTIVTPNVRTFDFTRRETAEVTRTFGGNRNLRPDDRRVISLGLFAKPFEKTDFTISADYLNTRIGNPIAAFPIATPEIEAAFPERFTRDGGGRLLRIDARPLNFERSDQEQVRFGLNFTRPLGSVPAELQNVRVRYVQSEADIKRRTPAGGTLTRVAPGSAEARRVENLTSRLFFSAYYTLRLQDEILLGNGAPALDLLNGSALDVRGGRPRHELEFQAGASKGGLGARVTATGQSGTTVSGFAAGVSGIDGGLRFSDYGTVNINLFANLADRFGGPDAPEWLKGTRVGLGIVNLFNARPGVRDQDGATPIKYQGAYLYPLGQLVSFSLRKVF